MWPTRSSTLYAGLCLDEAGELLREAAYGGSRGTGATAAAGNTTRIEAICSAASGGAITNSADIEWTSVSTSETYSHVSFWSASSGGTFLGSDDLAVPRAVLSGDNFTIAAGDLDLALTPIAA